MIKYEISESGSMLEASGNLLDLITDMTYLTSQIYHRLQPDLIKHEFKRLMQRMTDEDSPAWDKKNDGEGPGRRHELH